MRHHNVRLLNLLALSFLAVSMLLSNLGLFQSHGLALFQATEQKTRSAMHDDHAHFEDAPHLSQAGHVHTSDSSYQGHNPLDHSHETPSLPPPFQAVSAHFEHHFDGTHGHYYADRDLPRLERPPMKPAVI